MNTKSSSSVLSSSPVPTASIDLPSSQQTSTSHQRILRIFTKIFVVCVFGLIFKGALVKSHEAGLSVPDWPTSYGYNMFTFPIDKWVGGIFYEHLHRLLASGVGFLTLLLALLLWLWDRRPLMRKLGLLAVALVITQGVLGGLTVWYQLPVFISGAHGTLAQTFFVLAVIIAYAESHEFLQERRRSQVDATLLRGGLVCFALIYLQLIVAAAMRHTESGLAIPDFPTMGGAWLPLFNAEMYENINGVRRSLHLPAVETYQVVLHLLHRLLAFVILLKVIFLCRAAFRSTTASQGQQNAGIGLVITTVLQISLGIASVWTLRDVNLTSIHVVFGAALLGTATLFCLRSFTFNQAR